MQVTMKAKRATDNTVAKALKKPLEVCIQESQVLEISLEDINYKILVFEGTDDNYDIVMKRLYKGKYVVCDEFFNVSQGTLLKKIQAEVQSAKFVHKIHGNIGRHIIEQDAEEDVE